MTTVSNTSPVSNLAVIGRLPLLREVCGRILIPEAVREELGRLSDPAAQAAIQGALSAGWLQVTPVTDQTLAAALREKLDAGESEAITLAAGCGAHLLIDELDGRLVARRLGIKVRGALWVLRQARQMGMVASLKEEIRKLRHDANFWISEKLENELLASVGER